MSRTTRKATPAAPAPTITDPSVTPIPSRAARRRAVAGTTPSTTAAIPGRRAIAQANIAVPAVADEAVKLLADRYGESKAEVWRLALGPITDALERARAALEVRHHEEEAERLRLVGGLQRVAGKSGMEEMGIEPTTSALQHALRRTIRSARRERAAHAAVA